MAKKYLTGPVPDIDRDSRLYLAGLFDGEGSFMLHVNQHRGGVKYNARVQIAMSDLATISWVAEKLGRPILRHRVSQRTKHGSNAKPMYAVKLFNGAAIVSFIEQIAPHLITKRQAAETLADFCRPRLKINRRSPHDRQYTGAQIEAVHKLRDINRFGRIQ